MPAVTVGQENNTDVGIHYLGRYGPARVAKGVLVAPIPPLT
jgi:hypothetical protein